METNWYKNCSKKWLHSPRILFLFSQVQFFFDRGFIWRRDTLRWHKKLCFLFLCKKGIIDLPMVLIRYLFWCFSKETWQLSSWVELGITKKSLIKASSSFQRKYSIETKCKKKDSTNLKKSGTKNKTRKDLRPEWVRWYRHRQLNIKCWNSGFHRSPLSSSIRRLNPGVVSPSKGCCRGQSISLQPWQTRWSSGILKRSSANLEGISGYWEAE